MSSSPMGYVQYRTPNYLPFSQDSANSPFNLAGWLVEDAIDVRNERLFAACRSFSWLIGAIGPLEEVVARSLMVVPV